ncbi:IncV family inclusion membrane protein [Chlamydia pneumoniae]|uniref:Uncharacterized protein CPn_0443/CP_0310/CPj0443/CpB0459 n=2 Tax=Chlamydia pneumoniae TaxID=83558 RepID=Y443_CHLPN|nr:IncV family inclusion membrane protein [Chlamydia pneumoniae]Q9Z8A0.2 RecName: Full=Uncharacterized protein CPn_0443/CP_0310/CPj0443/CpB0459 [Chlamydia pneumoniae]AAF38167.1 conserved hypothetical protein [Chlamydia pneumoniae AR39]CRI35808.1 Uncharacterized protein CPn_0443/CP_0310/CPj0443/CpB0459 [Chlamydia pneumoniae]CRI41456.1 Uncharacterized protein CPn_0443/CP_0310/CPj0443/CpB0459 [Chlamydia pneumoniae]CRI73095.1 Uncharacterized protein CPn_0443/CP_0310/CPj0443/CpB0459 [Chlamydia pneu
MSQPPINPLGQPQVPAAASPSGQPSVVKRLKTSSTGLFKRFITVPDKYPKMRYVYDTGIIALAAIAILSILLTASGNSLMLYALAPALALGALGVTLLISDILDSPKAKKIGEAITAIVVPIIVLAIAAGLIAGAFVASSGTMLVFANPMFVMGLITVGLYFMSLNKLTLDYFRREHLLRMEKKTQETAEPILVTPSADDAKKIAVEKKKDLSASARMEEHEASQRQDARHRRIGREAQGSFFYSSRNPEHRRSFGSLSRFKTKPSDAASTRPASISPPFKDDFQPYHFKDLRSSSFGSGASSAFTPIMPASSRSPNFSTGTVLHPEPVYPKGGKEPSIPRVSSSSRRSPRDRQDKQQQQQNQDEEQKQQSKKKSGKSNQSLKTPPPDGKSTANLSPSNPFSDGYDEREKRKHRKNK